MGRIYFTNEQLTANGISGLNQSEFIEITPANSPKLLGREWLDGVRNANGQVTDLSLMPKKFMSAADLLICKVDDDIGYTVVTLGPIKKEALLCCYGSELISVKEVDPEDTTITPVDIGEDFSKGVLSAKRATNVAPYINHAPHLNAIEKDYQFFKRDLIKDVASPNLKRSLVNSTEADKPPLILLQAAQDIPAGHVLTYDYSPNYFFAKQMIPALFSTTGTVIPNSDYRYNYFVLQVQQPKSSMYIALTFKEAKLTLDTCVINSKNGTQIYFNDPEDKDALLEQMKQHLRVYTATTAFIGPLVWKKTVAPSSPTSPRLFVGGGAGAAAPPSAAQIEEMFNQQDIYNKQKKIFTDTKGNYNAAAHQQFVMQQSANDLYDELADFNP